MNVLLMQNFYELMYHKYIFAKQTKTLIVHLPLMMLFIAIMPIQKHLSYTYPSLGYWPNFMFYLAVYCLQNTSRQQRWFSIFSIHDISTQKRDHKNKCISNELQPSHNTMLFLVSIDTHLLSPIGHLLRWLRILHQFFESFILLFCAAVHQLPSFLFLLQLCLISSFFNGQFGTQSLTIVQHILFIFSISSIFHAMWVSTWKPVPLCFLLHFGWSCPPSQRGR